VLGLRLAVDEIVAVIGAARVAPALHESQHGLTFDKPITVITPAVDGDDWLMAVAFDRLGNM
jgi:hypothetical protein